jgi:glycine/D-amino acid oxidase-like deaminating enzyme
MNPTVVIVGAGVVGAALAQRLARLGWPTTLVDQYPPGHLRAASSGSDRFIRTAHGGDEQDTQSALEARRLWRELDLATPGSFLAETGLAFFVGEDDPWLEGSCRLLRASGIPHNVIDRAEAGGLFPALSLAEGEVMLVEEEAGVLSARQAVECLVDDAVASGVTFISGRATPASGAAAVAGDRLAADRTVWACGAWNAGLFPEFMDTEVIEQDNFFFGGPDTWAAAPLPAWSDLVRKFSGTCDLDGRGAKVASDCRGRRQDLDGPRDSHDPAQEAVVRDYLASRFPALAGAPLTGVEPCHSAVVRRNDLLAVATPGDLRIARHPEYDGVWILGDGAGHAFKHAPAIASLMEGLLA